MKFCTECGSKLAGGEKFCSECGYALTGSGKPSAAEKTESTAKAETAQNAAALNETAQSSTATVSATNTVPTNTNPLLKTLLKKLILSLIPPAIVLTPGLLLHLSSEHIASTIYMTVGTTIVLIFHYRKNWAINWASTLFPAIAFTLGYFIINFDMSYVRPPFFNFMLPTTLWGSLVIGCIAGIYWGIKKSLNFESGIVVTAGLALPMLVWGLVTSALLMSLTIVDVSEWITYFCFTVWVFCNSAMALLFFTLLGRRVFTFKKLSSVAAASAVLLGCLVLLPDSSAAQSFSEAEKQAYIKTEIPTLVNTMGEWFKQRKFRAAMSKSFALNHNTPKMNYSNAMGYQLSIMVGDDDNSPTWSAPAIRVLVLKYRTEQEAEAAVKNMVNSQFSKYSSGTKLHNVRTEQLGITKDSVRVIGNWNLPSGKETQQFTVFYSFGNYAMQQQEARSASSLKEKRQYALASSIRYALEQRGVRDGGVTSALNEKTPNGGNTVTSTNPNTIQPGRPLSNDILSGRSLGGGSSTGSGSNSSTDYYSPTTPNRNSAVNSGVYVPRPKNYQGSHLPDREVTQLTGLVSIVMLGATVLASLGSALFGAAVNGPK